MRDIRTPFNDPNLIACLVAFSKNPNAFFVNGQEFALRTLLHNLCGIFSNNAFIPVPENHVKSTAVAQATVTTPLRLFFEGMYILLLQKMYQEIKNILLCVEPVSGLNIFITAILNDDPAGFNTMYAALIKLNAKDKERILAHKTMYGLNALMAAALVKNNYLHSLLSLMKNNTSFKFNNQMVMHSNLSGYDGNIAIFKQRNGFDFLQLLLAHPIVFQYPAVMNIILSWSIDVLSPEQFSTVRLSLASLQTVRELFDKQLDFLLTQNLNARSNSDILALLGQALKLDDLIMVHKVMAHKVFSRYHHVIVNDLFTRKNICLESPSQNILWFVLRQCGTCSDTLYPIASAVLQKLIEKLCEISTVCNENIFRNNPTLSNILLGAMEQNFQRIQSSTVARFEEMSLILRLMNVCDQFPEEILWAALENLLKISADWVNNYDISIDPNDPHKNQGRRNCYQSMVRACFALCNFIFSGVAPNALINPVINLLLKNTMPTNIINMLAEYRNGDLKVLIADYILQMIKSPEPQTKSMYLNILQECVVPVSGEHCRGYTGGLTAFFYKSSCPGVTDALRTPGSTLGKLIAAYGHQHIAIPKTPAPSRINTRTSFFSIAVDIRLRSQNTMTTSPDVTPGP